MERCQKESLEHAPDQQQHQQQTTVEERCTFLSPTTPAWGDRNVTEQSVEETNNNYGFSFVQSDSRISSSSHSSSRNSSSSSARSASTEDTTNNQSLQFKPRKCKLCSFVATDKTENTDHIVTHCTFVKDTYVECDYSNGYDEEQDDSGNETQSKGKKRPKCLKPKPCNKCGFAANTKLTLWLHLRQHFIQEDCPGFVCPACPFATTLKHHMTFHWFSAHDDFKGYTCSKCPYTCVSQSMLTSHMKTHSVVYQYNCASCSYRTKFCNAMKKHLKDNPLHVAGTVLNPDGTPNPFATIDVYGSKRGPRRRPIVEEENELTESVEDRPSTSRIIASILTVPTSSALISSSPISTAIPRSTSSPNSPNSRMTLMSPVRTSPTRATPVRTSSTPVPSSYSNSLVKDTMATFNGMNNENVVNPSVNPSIDPSINQSTNEPDPLVLPSPVFTTLFHWWLREMTTRKSDDEEYGKVLRLLQNAQRFLFVPGYTGHVPSATGVNGGLFDNAKTIDEPSTSTTINGPSISMAIDEPSTSTAIDASSISTALVSEPQLVVEENGVPDEPLDLSMSAMSRTENQPQFQEPIASTPSRRIKRKRKATTRLEYPTTDEKTDENGTQTPNTKKIRTEPSLPAFLTASQSDLQRRSETLNIAREEEEKRLYHNLVRQIRVWSTRYHERHVEISVDSNCCVTSLTASLCEFHTRRRLPPTLCIDAFDRNPGKTVTRWAS